MVTTVTLNPAIDRTILIARLKHGAVNRINSVREDMGGKGINVSRILSSLGEDTQAIGFIGNHNLRHVNHLIEKAHIRTQFVEIDAPTRVNTKVVELMPGITTDLNEPGFCVETEELEKMIGLVSESSMESDYVVFSGSLPKQVPNNIYRRMIESLKGNALAVLDAEGELLLEGIKAHPTVIKPNIHELEMAVGRPLTSDTAIIEVGLDWLECYGIKYILVSMGGDGSLLICHEGVYKALPIPVEVKGTVGAGDSMLAGFIYGLRHKDLPQALAYATACGTLAVSKEGTEAFSKEEIDNMLKLVNIHKCS